MPGTASRSSLPSYNPGKDTQKSMGYAALCKESWIHPDLRCGKLKRLRSRPPIAQPALMDANSSRGVCSGEPCDSIINSRFSTA